MSLLNRYIFTILSQTFFPIFLTLYIITSIIFLVKIAALTSIIQMNFIELLQLYSYSIPSLLFYTLPIAYFISMALTISKLSTEYETIVLTSFGLNPLKIIKILLPTTAMVSVVLLVVSLGLVPKSKALKEIFLNEKKQEAQFNLKPSEYGQKLGSWMIYIDKEEKKKFKDITLLQLTKKQDTLISANWATMENDNNALTLKLEKGRSFSISDNLQQIDFHEMFLVNTHDKLQNIKALNNIFEYWKDRKINIDKSKRFTFYILISLFPLLSLFFILTLGYFNPRYHTNKTTMLASVVIVVFVLFTNQLSLKYPNVSLIAFPSFWIIISYIYYHLTTKKLY